MEKSLINTDLILLEVAADGKDDVLNLLADLVESHGRLADKPAFLASLYERERIAPTDIGYSVAIPHGKTDAVRVPTLVFLRLKNEIAWNDERVQLIFGIAVPETSSENLHLKMLQRIAKKIMNDEIRELLARSCSKEELLSVITA